MNENPGQAGAASPDVIRHLVLLGDALQNIDLGEGDPESALVPRPRNPWKLTVLDAPDILRQQAAGAIPADASHIGICVEGGWAIETSGLLQRGAQSIRGALDALASAADSFDELFARLIAASTETGLPTIVCTLIPARYFEPLQQRVAAAALAIFNDRILRRAFAARLSIVELRLVCDEDGDYASETLLSRAGARKVANVARSALYEVSREPGVPRVYF
ncbi:MAG TPA: hypothetical protein VH867_04425 [Burkholderiales bacterium]|jgi:hypothetical protein